MANPKENEQRQDSAEQLNLQVDNVIDVLDGGDDPFGLHGLGEVLSEGIDDIELPTVSEE